MINQPFFFYEKMEGRDVRVDCLFYRGSYGIMLRLQAEGRQRECWLDSVQWGDDCSPCDSRSVSHLYTTDRGLALESQSLPMVGSACADIPREAVVDFILRLLRQKETIEAHPMPYTVRGTGVLKIMSDCFRADALCVCVTDVHPEGTGTSIVASGK
ncbi:MAG: hypothetical protein Greene041619_1181 [Candidatus Peregrinibacteria bacterium Greene0416_19]|nr:MAG: hypothetical protein Greene041619_1181 [Candidatus Peregrinibacteria bacterium Greene0416_19]